jgi:hypothetical protein
MPQNIQFLNQFNKLCIVKLKELLFALVLIDRKVALEDWIDDIWLQICDPKLKNAFE